MISTRKWNYGRPGLLIPVFFLSLIPVLGQVSWQEASVAACGGSFVTRPGFSDAMYNQAGLGWATQSSVSIQHTRPFIISELGISSISAQVPTGHGSFGALFSSYGITGLRQSSVWFAYGLTLHQGITAGVGLHFWSSSIPERMFYHPGFSCALGIQARISDRFIMGCHVLHPAGWTTNVPGFQPRPMVLSAGCSYTFFQTTTYHADIHVFPEGYMQLSHGIQLVLRDRAGFMMGIHNRPFAVSGGLTLSYLHWNIHLAFEYMTDIGSTPSSSLTYAW